jgi:hypothetical protein
VLSGDNISNSFELKYNTENGKLCIDEKLDGEILVLCEIEYLVVKENMHNKMG